MSFTGNEDHSISLEAAATLTASYRTLAGSLAIKAEYFSKSSLLSVLNQNDCVGIRVYYGIAALVSPRLIIVGVKANEDDIVEGEILEMGLQCPPNCGSLNDLNS
jgi:hypothetical protein